MSVLVGGNRQINTFNNFEILRFLDGTITIANATTYRVSDSTGFDQFTGNFLYDADGVLIGGTITGWTRSTGGGTEFTLSGFSYPVTTFLADLETGDSAGAMALIFGGPDKMTGSTGGDVLYGYGGADTISGAGGGDVIFAGDAGDKVDGGAIADVLFGEAGNDTMLGGAGGDIIYGDIGNDSIAGGSGGDIIFGNADADTIDGGADGDIIFGDAGKDSLAGGAGDDIILGGADADTMAGGAGNDSYNDVAAGDDIIELAGQGVDTVIVADASYLMLDNFENLILAGAGNTVGIGNKLGNEMTGNADNNQLLGVDGNDTLKGGAGIDTLTGGKGDDLFYVETAGDKVSEDLDQGKDTVRTALITYTLTDNVENLELLAGGGTGTGNGLANRITGEGGGNTLHGQGGNDSIDAGGGDDELHGEADNDSLNGGEGNDWLFGGLGADIMSGGKGQDTYEVNDKNDKAIEGAGGGEDRVISTVNMALGANVEHLDLQGAGATIGTGNGLNNQIQVLAVSASLSGLAGNDSLTGAGGNDTLIGGDGNDVLVGNGGNDSLAGGAGIDQLIGNGGNNTMAGGAGTDIYFVESSGDVVVESGPGIDQVNSKVDYALPDEAAIEYFFLNAGTNATGNKFANYIFGNAGDNSLAGGGGNDTLSGGPGADTTAGNEGDDSYHVDQAGDKISELPGQGIDTLIATYDGVNLVSYANVENLTLLEFTPAAIASGSGGANLIIGNSNGNTLLAQGGDDTVDGWTGNDSIDGGSGNDKLTGGDGADTLEGGIGDDTMIGGKGTDYYYVNSAKDVLIEAAEPSSFDTLFSTVDNIKLANNVESLVLQGAAITGSGNALANLVNGNGNDNKLFGLAGKDSMYGGGGNDLLDGGAGDDAIQSGGGADTMIGGAGNDHYFVDSASISVVEAAGGGTDLIETSLNAFDLTTHIYIEDLTFDVAAGDVVGTGNKLNNLIKGEDGNDKLFGKDGNDILNGAAGDDTMEGGSGDDTYYLLDAGDVIVEGAGDGKDTIISDVNFTDLSLAALQNIEALFLADNANNAQGNGLANKITGNGNGNILQGGGGNDTLFGELDPSSGAADTLVGQAGNDLMVGGRGSDWYGVEDVGDKIVEQAGQGTDVVFASVDHTLAANVEHLSMSGAASKGTGNALDNIINGNSSDDLILGLGGNDSLSGLNGNDTIDGGTGDDTVYGGIGNDKLTGGTQNDFLHGENGADTLIGGDGSNAMYGDDGNDSLLGGATYDTLDGGIGVDTMAGGGGQDSYQVDNISDQVKEGAGQGDDGVTSKVDYILSENVERLELVGTAVTGYGNKLGNSIAGNSQNNKLAGFEGNDTLSGGFGGEADTMYGGAGDDTYYVDSLSDTVDETVGAGGSGKDTIIASIDVAGLPVDIENLRLQGSAVNGTGNAQNNKIEGTGGGNILAGLGGADTLIGNNGDDTLDGGDGADSMVGGDGGDDYYVNNAGDKVMEAAGGGSDWVYADVNYTLAANVERLMLVNAVNGTGNGLYNVIFGNGFANKLTGLGGNDTIDGGTATDTLDGGDGNDSLVGGTENDSLLGGNGLDTLDGGSGADTLIGGAGNDTLAGGAGTDSLDGGTGDDFYFVDSAFDAIGEGAGQGVDAVLSTATTYTLANNVENLHLAGSAVTGIGNGLNNLIQGANVGVVANNLQGGAGNDTLSGYGGADTLTGGAGRDTFRPSATDAIDSITDFDAGPLGDTLDLSDLLTGYTAGVSDANDFVQFTNLGGKTQVFVDQDGAVGGAIFVEVAELNGVILSNVNQAVLEGNLELV